MLAPALSVASLAAGGAQAQLVGAKVVAGKATITETATGAVIDELTPKAVITYSSFSLPQNFTLTVESSVTGSLLINKVTGGVASVLASGSLITGAVQFWLINPAGITVAPGASINTAAVLLSTLGVSAHSGGNYTFGVPGDAGAGVTNGGTITATGGYAVLAGEQVSNTGVIAAALGTVVLAGGATTYAVDFSGDHLLSFAITTPVAQANGTLVSNTGTVAADGGLVLLTAASAKAVLDNVINTSGIVEATSVANVDGKIVLSATGGGTEVSGTLDASGKGAGQTGGEVDVLSDQSVTLDSGALVDVSGDAGGGTALIGGNFHGAGPQQDALTTTVAANATINASAITTGNGGNIAVWSNDNTYFDGSIAADGGALSGNGGRIETSGANLTIGPSAIVMAMAPNGTAGTWLLDPDTLEVEAYSGIGITNSEFPFDEGGNEDPYYPTASDLVFQFSSPVSGVAFFFDNDGDNGISSYFTITSGVSSTPVNISGDEGTEIEVPGSGINELVISNGCPNSACNDGGVDWYFNVTTLSFNDTSIDFTELPAGPVSPTTFAEEGLASLSLSGTAGVSSTSTPSTTGTPLSYLVAPPPPPPPPAPTPPITTGGPPPPPSGGSTSGGGDIGTVLGGGGGSDLFGSGGGGTPPEPISEPPPPIHPAPNPTPMPQTSDLALGGGLFQSHQTFVEKPGEVFGINTPAPSDGNWSLYWSAGFLIQ